MRLRDRLCSQGGKFLMRCGLRTSDNYIIGRERPGWRLSFGSSIHRPAGHRLAELRLKTVRDGGHCAPSRIKDNRAPISVASSFSKDKESASGIIPVCTDGIPNSDYFLLLQSGGINLRIWGLHSTAPARLRRALELRLRMQ